jgi:hypothetical protein
MKRLLNFILTIILLFTASEMLAQPANDDACNATAIAVENTGCEPTTTYTYSGATPSGWGGCSNGTQDPDVWYKFTVPANGQFTFKMDHSAGNFDFIIASFYYGNCGSLIPFQSNNSLFCFFSLPFTGTGTNLTPGSTVYFRVYRPLNGPSSGTFRMCVSNNNGLADEPCNAGFIDMDAADPLGQPCLPTRTYSYSGATLTPAVSNPACQTADYAAIRDVWFKIRVPQSGKVNVATTLGQGTVLTAYSATACNGTFTQIGCAIYNPLSFNSTPGSDIYIRVHKWTGGPVPAASVSLCAAERNDFATVNNNLGRIGIAIDTPFAKLDVAGNGIFRDKLTVGSDLETRGDLIVQGNIINRTANTGLTGQLTLDSLAFPSRLGNKLSLWGGFAGSHYGFGIQGGTLQMFTDAPGAVIGFGYGNSSNFTERARIIQQGEYGMTLKGRMQLLTGTNSAGLWLTNASNVANVSFIGLLNDNQVGFFGTGGAGWGVTMNTVTANVGIGLNGVNPTRPLSFPAALGEKILLYPGGVGEVGIGVYGNELRLHADNPGAKVSFGTQDNSGVFTEVGKFEKNGAYALSVFGSIWANGTTYASDGRFKKNIAPLRHSLERILKLDGVSYQMKTEEFPGQHFDGNLQVGLIAQDVEKIVPEVVLTNKEGYKAIDYAKLVPLLVESIKTQQAQLEALKKEVEALKRKIQ